jgi:CxxC motif-containing protein (DUF1111 family)
MCRIPLSGQRRSATFGFLGLAAAGVYWAYFSAGIPVIWGPSAKAADVAAGKELFEHEWTANDPLAHGDGLGPVFNARSCVACHNQGGVGGGGDLAHNAVSFEIGPRPSDPTFRSGTVHAFSVDPAHKESMAVLKKVYPTINGRTTGNPQCPTVIPDYDPVRTQPLQATALFGAGWVDLISDKAITHNRRARQTRGAVRELGMEFENVPVGRVRTLDDGRVGKFGWKAQFASLDEFVAAACANELGLGTPTMEQARPLAAPNRISVPDLDATQFRQLVSFVKMLPKPVETEPTSPADRAAAARGKELFSSVGCAACHVPDLGGVKGVYSDFLLYTLDDPAPPGSSGGSSYVVDPPVQLNLPPRPDADPKPEEWKTPALWGVADSAPYWHDGSADTLPAAILRHRGDGKGVTAKYQQLSTSDQAAVVAFLKTLKAPPDAAKPPPPPVKR